MSLDLDRLRRLWIPAIASGYARPEDWIEWADRMILKLDEPPGWVIEMAMIDCPIEAIALLLSFDGYSRIEALRPYRHEFVLTVLGYLHLKSVREHKSVEACVLASGDWLLYTHEPHDNRALWSAYAYWIALIDELCSFPEDIEPKAQRLNRRLGVISARQYAEIEKAAA
ncbi:MAG: hypothetical protein RIG82_04515 [Phycisphaeraceae bacterium]